MDQRSGDDSVDELRTSSFTRGISMPNFEVLDARIASALNRIIHNSHFKRRVSLEEQKPKKRTVSFVENRSLFLIYEYFRVTGANDSVEIYADLFPIGLRNDDIQEFVERASNPPFEQEWLDPEWRVERLWVYKSHAPCFLRKFHWN